MTTEELVAILVMLQGSNAMTTEELVAILVMLQGSKHPVRVMRNDNNPKGESFAISEVRSGFNSVDGRCTYILIQSEVNVPDKR